MTVLMDKIREVFVSVVPITVIVLILSFTLTPMSGSMIARFLLGAVSDNRRIICISAGRRSGSHTYRDPDGIDDHKEQ